MQQDARRLDLDRIGASASALCALHCLLTGLAMGVLPLLGIAFIASPIVDLAMISVAVLVGAWALWNGYRRHQSVAPAIVYATGLAMIAIAHFGLGHRNFGVLATILAVSGGFTLVAYHILNRRLLQRCSTR